MKINFHRIMRPVLVSAIAGASLGLSIYFIYELYLATRRVELPSLIGEGGSDLHSLSQKNAYITKPADFFVYEDAAIELFVVEPEGRRAQNSTSDMLTANLSERSDSFEVINIDEKSKSDSLDPVVWRWVVVPKKVGIFLVSIDVAATRADSDGRTLGIIPIKVAWSVRARGINAIKYALATFDPSRALPWSIVGAFAGLLTFIGWRRRRPYS